MKGNLAIVGLQWGDEGKGKIVDVLSEKYDIIARFQGGHNAGHTVYIDKEKVILHLIPSGILWKHTTCVIGNGVVIDLKALKSEMSMLENLGVSLERRLLISKKAHLIFPYHVTYENQCEESLAEKKIGTTMRGVGPSYEDKIGRRGIQIADIENLQYLKEKLSLNIDYYKHYYRVNKNEILEAMLNEIVHVRPHIVPYLADVTMYLTDKMEVGDKILFEGAQGTMLDIDHGTYPYVTSSSTVSGGICTGLGISPTKIGSILGIMKAYVTRVGGGVFPTEIYTNEAEIIRQKGKEYGATTGRPRRCGWLDLVALKYACTINGCESLAVTKLDVLDDFDKIKICVAYQHKNEILTDFPSELWILQECTPVYKEIPGWKTNTHSLKNYDDVPLQAKNYLKAIEDYLGCSIALLSNGPTRKDIITVKGIE
ncbi:MAG: adenylosuccinate synthase [Candidatus Fischerbacteria bacterium RBG_13_37_8]|uniref:Adenylosuccinate synthetase n=1 Tax=Candidatus Fischerbacteria bacterium RBG_13_37_8 TaxID=1817863 RepID=A0A1F5VGZ9_9BACT|nr:MAG: adenylosuccinate synthase [Candidatus Fischerbacteria bacterium RBG_13_37_8]